jgi:hypothetical protein
VKNTISTFKKSQNYAWKKGGVSLQDSTSPYSEMHGGLENAFDPDDFERQENKSKQARVVDTLETRAREAGL